MTWQYQFNQWIWGILDLVIPPSCGGCQRGGYRWCPECQAKVQVVPEPICSICGELIRHVGHCANCRHEHPPFKQHRSWMIFSGPVRQALHSLKYKNNLPLGDALARQMVPFTRELGWPVDIVVPVPLGRKRMAERGYNQVGLVAMPIAHMNHWDYAPRAINRIRDTPSQVGLPASERKLNVAGAFRGDPSLVQGKVVLVMDDVATTGSTIAACAVALRMAGAKEVYALTIARATYQQQSSIA